MPTEIRLPPKWIELNVHKRECVVFVPSTEDGVLCQCGKPKAEHPTSPPHRTFDTWIPSAHTKAFPTDAYGTIIFEGEHHPNKSHYVRLAHDTNPELVISLMTLVWGLPMPKFLITIHGSTTDFELSARLGKILQVGLLKAAKTTGAWLFTNGINRGVAKHIGTALGNQRLHGFKRSRVVSVGICAWGIVQSRESLIGHNRDRTYNQLENSSSKYVILNARHSNFLFVDNGSVGKLGGEAIFRRRLEQCITRHPTNRGCDTPLVALIIGGSGYKILRSISDYLYEEPPVPVFIYDTGASELIVTVLKRIYSGLTIEDIKDEVCGLIARKYRVNSSQAEMLIEDFRRIVQRQHLVMIYNPNTPDCESFDTALLASIFRSQHWTPLQQLSLTLVWDRVDICTHEVFVYGRDWSRESLEQAMMEALSSNRLDFVELLIEHGLNVQTFLTPKRLEELYSLDRTYSVVMRTLLFEIARIHVDKINAHGGGPIFDKVLTLHDIGIAMSHMMGHVYKSRYSNFKSKKRSIQGDDEAPAETAMANVDFYFTQPFDDLFIWAVLTKRHSTAILLWKHGIGGLAKALVAVRLNKYMAAEFASAEKTETNFAAEFKSYAEQWEELSYSLLDACFKMDCTSARQILTMELEHWSKETCLTLAVMATHRMLLGHPCCQILLADLWMGALSLTKHTTLKVVAGVFFPPLSLFLDFKTGEELNLLPHQSRKEGPMTGVSLEDQQLLDDASLQTFSKSKASIPSSIFRQRFPRTTVQAEEDNVIPAFDESGHHHERHKAEVLYRKQPVTHGSHGSKGLDNMSSTQESEESVKHTHRHGAAKEMYDSGRYGRTSYVRTIQDLSLWRKLYESQTAPVSNFYRHMIAYVAFLSCLYYVILVPQDPVHTGKVEIYIISYLVTLGFDTIREFAGGAGNGWSQKWNQFQMNTWCFSDLVIIIFSLGGTASRLYSSALTTDLIPFMYGMLIYKVSSVYWTLRLYKYMSNHRWVGPKLVMMTRMLRHMIYFAMIILVVLMAFGISREAIRFPDTYPTWRSTAEALIEPYVMFYGEIDVDTLSPQCGELDQPKCPIGHWIIPLTWTIYMMVANILIVNVLIAVFNGIYAEVDAIALELWMFQRFTFVMEFESKPVLPPPFVIICHLFYALRYFYRKCRFCICEEELEESGLDIEDGRRVYIGNDRSLKIYLNPTEATRIFDFEEDIIEGINTQPSHHTSENDTYRRGARTDPYGASVHTTSFEISEGRQQFETMATKIIEISNELEDQKDKLTRILNYLEQENDNDSETKSIRSPTILVRESLTQSYAPTK